MGKALERIWRPVAAAALFVFLKIAEPRVVRIIQFGIYLGMGWAGHYILLNPPTSFQFVLGDSLVAVFGGFLTLGGLLGAIAVLPGIWWLERMAVVSLWTGLGMFAVIAISLGVSAVGFVIAICLSLSLILRWFEIRKFELAPRES